MTPEKAPPIKCEKRLSTAVFAWSCRKANIVRHEKMAQQSHPLAVRIKEDPGTRLRSSGPA